MPNGSINGMHKWQQTLHDWNLDENLDFDILFRKMLGNGQAYPQQTDDCFWARRLWCQIFRHDAKTIECMFHCGGGANQTVSLEKEKSLVDYGSILTRR